MKSIVTNLVLGISLVLCAQAQQRGMKVVEMQDEKGQRFVAYDNSYALVVGINKYADPKIPSLNYAVQDAHAIAQLLEDMDFPKENIKILQNEEATLTRVKEEFAAMGSRTKKNDRLLVYWAGHGETESLPRGGEMGYLIPTDGKSNAMYSTCLSMDEVKRLSERVAAKHVLFLVDACYGGLSAVTSRSLTKETELYLQKVTSAEAIQIITAGTRDEQVVESPTWGHSAFAKAILDGFQTRLVDQDGNSVVTADELYSYLQARVFELSRSESPKGHRPVFANLKASEGQFAFVVAVPTYTLSIKGLPAKNAVYIGGKKVSENKDTVQQTLRRGTYTVEVEALGRERYSTSIDLSTDRELTPRMISLIIPYMLETNPTGAGVKIDGMEVGLSPVKKELSIGQHRIEIKKEGYETLTFTSNVSEQNSYEMKELKLALFGITVISNPSGAQIFLNDLPQGLAPSTIQVRPGSKYTVELQWEGKKLATTFQPAGSGAVTADFNAGQIQYSGPTVQPPVTIAPPPPKKEEQVPPVTAQKEKQPEPAPLVAYLEISVEPSDASITVDGKTVSPSGGVAKVEVKPGRRVVLISKSGYESEKSTVDVYPGDTKKMNVKLSQETSSKTWLYVLGGAAVAGGAAYFLLAKKAPASSVSDPYGNPPGFPGNP